jgi:hypothetical protein
MEMPVSYCVKTGIMLMSYYKPVSRILFPLVGGRLSFICPQHCCWDQSAYPSASDEQPLSGKTGTLTYVAFQHARFTRI